MYHTMMRNGDGSWSVGRAYERGQKLHAMRDAQTSALTYSRRTRVVEYTAGGFALGDVVAIFGEDGEEMVRLDKKELDATIDELDLMLTAARRDVNAATVAMDAATAVLDDARDRLDDAKLESTHADCLHSEAYARYEALCHAIRELRAQYAAV